MHCTCVKCVQWTSVNISEHQYRAVQCSVLQCKAGAAGFQLCFLIKPNSPLVVNMSGKFQPDYSAVHWTTMQSSGLHCTLLQLQFSAEQDSAVQCSAVQCSVVQCSAVQCSAVQCSAVQCSAVYRVQHSRLRCSAIAPLAAGSGGSVMYTLV